MSMTWSWMTVKLHCEQTDGRWEIYVQREITVWEETKAEFLHDWMMDSKMFKNGALDRAVGVNNLIRTALP